MLINVLLFVMLRFEGEDALSKVFVLLEDRFVAAHDLFHLVRVFHV